MLANYPTDTPGADGACTYYMRPDGTNGCTIADPHSHVARPARVIGHFYLGLNPGDRHGFVPLDDVAHAHEVERDTAPDA